jgi:hypothetical protein
MSGNTSDTTTTNELSDALRKLLHKGSAEERQCSLAKFISESPEEFQLAMNQILGSNLSHRAIFIELHKAGVKISRETITLHRTGRCICSTGDE